MAKSFKGSLEICMLGKFSITMGDRVLVQNLGRTKRVWALIEYLIANRHQPILIEKLMEAIWEDEDETDQPLNALKNLVYRARNELKKLTDEPVEFILYQNNTYSWNNDIPCVIDAEEFTAAVDTALSSKEDGPVRVSAAQRAVELYTGEFLPASNYSVWAVTQGATYSAAYKSVVICGYELLMDAERFQEAVAICEAGLKFALYEEDLHEALCKAYVAAGMNREAIKHYYYTSDLFYKEFGMDVSQEMRDLYRQVLKETSRTEMDLPIIKADLREAEHNGGAFFCDYEIFKHVYRVQARSMLRSGMSICVALLSLCSKETVSAHEKNHGGILNLLKEIVRTSLRKGDVFSLYSSTQFLIMLPGTSLENAQMVTQRIVRKFSHEVPNTELWLVAKVSTIDSVDL